MGRSGQARQVGAGCVVVCNGMVGQARLVQSGSGESGLVMVRQAGFVTACRGQVRSVGSRFGMAGALWFGLVRFGRARLGPPVSVWRGVAGEASRGWVSHGMVCYGVA